MTSFLATLRRTATAFAADWRSHGISLGSLLFFLFVFYQWFGMPYVTEVGEMMPPVVTDPLAYMVVGLVVVAIFDAALRTPFDARQAEEYGAPVPSGTRGAVEHVLSVAVLAAGMGMLVYGIGFAVGKRVTTPVTVIASLGVIVLLALVFAGLGVLLAGLVRRLPTLIAEVTILTLFLPFLSGAYLSLHLLPDWMQVLARFNPVTYGVAAFRAVSRESWSLPVDQMLAQELSLEVAGTIVTPGGSLWLLAGAGVVFGALAVLVTTRRARR